MREMRTIFKAWRGLRSLKSRNQELDSFRFVAEVMQYVKVMDTSQPGKEIAWEIPNGQVSFETAGKGLRRFEFEVIVPLHSNVTLIDDAPAFRVRADGGVGSTLNNQALGYRAKRIVIEVPTQVPRDLLDKVCPPEVFSALGLCQVRDLTEKGEQH